MATPKTDTKANPSATRTTPHPTPRTPGAPMHLQQSCMDAEGTPEGQPPIQRRPLEDAQRVRFGTKEEEKTNDTTRY